LSNDECGPTKQEESPIPVKKLGIDYIQVIGPLPKPNFALRRRRFMQPISGWATQDRRNPAIACHVFCIQHRINVVLPIALNPQ
jgi:hypothetical protein